MKELILEKLYYGKFTHRAVIKNYKAVKLKTKTRYDIVHNHDDIVRAAKEMLGTEMRSRLNGYWSSHNLETALFFNDESFVQCLQDAYGEQLVSIERPKDAAHIELLKEKFVTRRTLFHGRFRYRFRLNEKKVALNIYNWWSSRPTKDPRVVAWEEMEQWIKDQLPEEKNLYRMEGDVFVGTNGYAPTVFFNEYKHATMFKLAWNDNVKEFVRVKLHDEI